MDFNWPALQEGAVCSWSFNGFNYRIDRVLESRLHRIRFTKELMEILCFSFPFLRFCWFWGFQPATPSRRSALFMKVIWDEIWRALRAWISSNQIPIRTRTHGDIQVFHFHFAILRISTGQRFRKERSIHEACIGWILEGIERFNFVQTESISPKNWWRYSGFSLKFCWFSWSVADVKFLALGCSHVVVNRLLMRAGLLSRVGLLVGAWLLAQRWIAHSRWITRVGLLMLITRSRWIGFLTNVVE